jgi:hypothetical protein
VAEIVESDMPIGDVMTLLVSRGLAESFPPGAPIFCKRQDGSTVPLKVDPMQSLSNLEGKIKQAEVMTVYLIIYDFILERCMLCVAMAFARFYMILDYLMILCPQTTSFNFISTSRALKPPLSVLVPSLAA